MPRRTGLETMKILIYADSRGVNHQLKDDKPEWADRVWAPLIQDRLRDHEVQIPSKVRSTRLRTLYGAVRCLEERKETYDLVILQVGLVEWILGWPIEIWNHLLPAEQIDERFLKRIGTSESFWYHDAERVREYFQRLRRWAGHVLCVGASAWSPGHLEKLPYQTGPTAPLEANALYSRLADGYIHLPMHPDWNARNTSDGIHLLPPAAKYVAGCVERYVRRLERTVPCELERTCRDQTIVVEGTAKTARQFYQDALRAGAAIARTTHEDDVVLISKRTSFEQIEAFIGCICFKRIPIIIQHPSVKVCQAEFTAKMRKIDQAVHPKLCLCDEQEHELYSQMWPSLTRLAPDGATKPAPCKIEPEDVAFFQLSSGTTGLPKVIRVLHKDLIAHCDEYATFLDLKREDVIVSWLPLYHDMGMIACFMMPLLRGAGFVHIHPFHWLAKPLSLLEAIERYKGTHVWMPNFAFALLARRITAPCPDLSSMKMFINCSEPTRREDMLAFREACRRAGAELPLESLRVCYALAENIFAVSQSDGIKTTRWNEAEVVSCGRLIPGTSVLIVRNGRDVTNTAEGEIYIKSSYLPPSNPLSEYDYYATGDIGFMEGDELYVLGRKDDMIISYGNNVFPYEIEALVSQIEGVVPGRVACFGVRNDEKGTEDIYVCAESPYEDPSRKQQLALRILQAVRARFDLSVSCRIVPRGWIIKTSSGKISRKRTRAKLLEQTEESQPCCPSMSDKAS